MSTVQKKSNSVGRFVATTAAREYEKTIQRLVRESNLHVQDVVRRIAAATSDARVHIGIAAHVDDVIFDYTNSLYGIWNRMLHSASRGDTSMFKLEHYLKLLLLRFVIETNHLKTQLDVWRGVSSARISNDRSYEIYDLKRQAKSDATIAAANALTRDGKSDRQVLDMLNQKGFKTLKDLREGQYTSRFWAQGALAVEPGEYVRFSNFTSTTLNPYVAPGGFYCVETGILFHMRLPVGMPFFYITGREYEVLLPPCTEFIVMSPGVPFHGSVFQFNQAGTRQIPITPIRLRAQMPRKTPDTDSEMARVASALEDIREGKKPSKSDQAYFMAKFLREACKLRDQLSLKARTAPNERMGPVRSMRFSIFSNESDQNPTSATVYSTSIDDRKRQLKQALLS